MENNQALDLKQKLKFEHREKFKDLAIKGMKDRGAILILGELLIIVGNLTNITEFPWILLIVFPVIIGAAEAFQYFGIKKDFYQVRNELFVNSIDIIVITITVYYTGLHHSPFFILYFLIIIHYAIDMGMKLTMINATMTVLAYIVILLIGSNIGKFNINLTIGSQTSMFDINPIYEIARCVLLFYTAFIAASLGNRNLVRLAKLRKTMALVEEGNIDVRTELEGKDEVGWTLISFNKMLDNLNELAAQAEAIANDDLNNEVLDIEIKGKLGDAFARMVTKLRKLLKQAEFIEADDLKNPILTEKMSGDLGSTFSGMVDKLIMFSKRAELITSGNLKVKDSFKMEGKCLVKSFDDMEGNLREVILNIKKAGFKIASSSTQILSASEELASGAGEQAASVEETSSTVEEFATTATQIAENAEIVAKLAEETLTITEAGTKKMTEALYSIEGIKTSSQNTSKRILELGDKSNRIGDIVEMIDEISSQTKLLALNASIEAAGAGEAGKRFGVVAVEIKKLAETVAESTEEISHLVSEIQLSINSSIMSTEDEIKKVEEGVLKAGKVNDLLVRLYSMVEKTTDASKQISFATQQQKTAGEQVVFTMKDIANVTKQSAVSTKEVMNSTEELSKLAEDFKDIVDKFELE
ncbi:HAMP domain-containing protein [Candidatus Dependentiae bacterium]|nr:HAMP domain-containing protein [Candidatus Dependentiae bacterium]